MARFRTALQRFPAYTAKRWCQVGPPLHSRQFLPPVVCFRMMSHNDARGNPADFGDRGKASGNR